MQTLPAITIVLLAFTFLAFAQDDLPTFKAEAASAFVWGEDNPSGAVSSSSRDPVTGSAIFRLHHAGIEVSSTAGFEKIGMGEAGELPIFSTTIVNNTDSGLSIRQGAVGVDGNIALPLPVVLTKKGLHKKERKEAWELSKLHCFSSGFFTNHDFVLSPPASKILTLAPNTALTVSSVTKDPRNYSLLCSVEGCYPKGTIRYSVTVNSTDFVFVWPGRSVAYCGK
jgi:hypothetical protein